MAENPQLRIYDPYEVPAKLKPTYGVQCTSRTPLNHLQRKSCIPAIRGRQSFSPIQTKHRQLTLGEECDENVIFQCFIHFTILRAARPMDLFLEDAILFYGNTSQFKGRDHPITSILRILFVPHASFLSEKPFRHLFCLRSQMRWLMNTLSCRVSPMMPFPNATKLRSLKKQISQVPKKLASLSTGSVSPDILRFHSKEKPNARTTKPIPAPATVFDAAAPVA